MKKCPNSQRILRIFAGVWVAIPSGMMPSDSENTQFGLAFMPILQKIVISDFRNIRFQEIEFSPKINCVWGNNGEGKTNLLDAIYYLSMTKSAFGVGDSFNCRHGCDGFSLAGTYRMPSSLQSRFSISVKRGEEKKLRCDDKPYARISEHIGKLPVVIVAPSDTSLVSDSGDERRRFINAVISQISPEYLSALQQYNRLLSQRNRLLKEESLDPALLDVIDFKMSSLADAIHAKREEFCRPLTEAVNEYCLRLSGEKERVGIRYRSEIDRAPLTELLKESFERDRIMKYTTVGVQRDDFIFEMDGYPIRRFGSQGQQKTFLLALKLAQFDLMREAFGFAPLLLLDDVFDKLDMLRTKNLLQMVSSDDFGQIFITDSNKVRMSSLVESLESDKAYFETADGEFTRTEK